jgi:hypothetical protein
VFAGLTRTSSRAAPVFVGLPEFRTLTRVTLGSAMVEGQTPSMADWLQAWGTIAAAVFSALAVLFAALLLRHELVARREEQADRDAAQARLVFPEVESAASQHDEFMGDEYTSVSWRLVNLSRLPIPFAAVRVSYEDAGSGRRRRQFFQVDGRIDPQSTATGTWELQPPVPANAPFDETFEVDAEFLDAAGLRWRREAWHPPQRDISIDMHPPYWRNWHRGVYRRAVFRWNRARRQRRRQRWGLPSEAD